MNDAVSTAPLEPSRPVPMTFGQILDRTYRLTRANLRLFFGIACVPSAGFFLLIAVIMACIAPRIFAQIAQDSAPSPTFPTYLGALFIALAYPVLFVLFALYLPAASYAATQADRGISVTIREAYSVAWRRFWRYLWLMILPALFVVVPLVVIAALLGIGALLLHNNTSFTSDPATMFFLIPVVGLLYIGFMVYCVLIMLRFAVAYPASVTEDLTAWDSLQRSAQLTKGSKGRIFLVLLVIYAITYAVNLVMMLIFFVLVAVVAGISILAHVTQDSPAFFVLIGLGVLGYALVILACTMFAYAVYTTALAVLYRDQRLRIDGPLPATPLPAGDLF